MTGTSQRGARFYMNQSKSKYLRTNAAAELLGVTRNTVRRLGDTGVIRCWRDDNAKNKRRAFLRKDLIEIKEKFYS